MLRRLLLCPCVMYVSVGGAGRMGLPGRPVVKGKNRNNFET